MPGRNLYLSRKAGLNNRAVLNEDRGARRCWSRSASSVVDPGDLSLVEQIRLFAEADVIVAPHGASLANLPFCSPGSTLLELFPSQSMVADYWKMTCGVEGLEYQYLSGDRSGCRDLRREQFVVADITVDLPAPRIHGHGSARGTPVGDRARSR